MGNGKMKSKNQIINDYYVKLINSIEKAIKQDGCYYDDIYNNKFTQTKPSDIRDIDIRILSIASLISNHASWDFHNRNHMWKSEIYEEVYCKCCDKIYSTADQYDCKMFYSLSN